MFFAVVVCLFLITGYVIAVSLFTIGFLLKKTEINFQKCIQKVSVIVPFRNEEENIINCLNSLLNQNNKELFEVILVNDNSTDNSVELIKDFQEKQSILNLKLLTLNSFFGKKEAIKLGVENAKNEIIITTDVDCEYDENWLEKSLLYFQNQQLDLLIMPVLIGKSKGFLQKFQAIDFLSLQAITFGSAYFSKPMMCNGANLMFNKRLYFQALPFLSFDKASGDDMFLLNFAQKNNFNVGNLSGLDVVVKTKAVFNLKEFINQRMRWVSKTPSIKNRFTHLVGFFLFGVNLLIPTLFFMCFFDLKYLSIFAIIFGVKSIVDFLLVFSSALHFKQLILMKYFIPTQLVYSFGIVLIMFLSLFKEASWKGRAISV